MRKYLFAIFLSIISTVGNAGWHIHADDGCALETRFLARDYYYFCGAHAAKCHGDWADNTELKNGFVKWFSEDGKTAQSFGNERYWCCDGQITGNTRNIQRKGSASGTAGRWVKGTTFAPVGDVVKKQKTVGSGTCTYEEWKDICGNLYSTESDCNNPSKVGEMVNCPDGHHYRNGACAPYCDVDQVYESRASNRCIACPENSVQGVVLDGNDNPMNQYCLKCNPSSQLFDPKTRTCMDKTSSIAASLSRDDLLYGKTGKSSTVSDNCWTKFNDEYRKCVLGAE